MTAREVMVEVKRLWDAGEELRAVRLLRTETRARADSSDKVHATREYLAFCIEHGREMMPYFDELEREDRDRKVGI